MIQQPYYTLADLNEEERQVYEEITKSRLKKLDEFKKFYCRNDVKLWLKRELQYCNNVIRDVAEAKEAEKILASVAQLSNCGTPPKIKQPYKWEYVYAVEYYDVFERELEVLKFAENEEQYKKQPRGRNTDADFKSCVCDPAVADDVLEKLHEKADGKKGKLFAYIICAAVKANLITRPSYNQCECEFENIGRKQGYSKYINEANSSNADTQILQPLVTYFMEIKKSVI